MENTNLYPTIDEILFYKKLQKELDLNEDKLIGEYSKQLYKNHEISGENSQPIYIKNTKPCK